MRLLTAQKIFFQNPPIKETTKHKTYRELLHLDRPKKKVKLPSQQQDEDYLQKLLREEALPKSNLRSNSKQYQNKFKQVQAKQIHSKYINSKQLQLTQALQKQTYIQQIIKDESIRQQTTVLNNVSINIYPAQIQQMKGANLQQEQNQQSLRPQSSVRTQMSDQPQMNQASQQGSQQTQKQSSNINSNQDIQYYKKQNKKQFTVAVHLKDNKNIIKHQKTQHKTMKQKTKSITVRNNTKAAANLNNIYIEEDFATKFGIIAHNFCPSFAIRSNKGTKELYNWRQRIAAIQNGAVKEQSNQKRQKRPNTVMRKSSMNSFHLAQQRQWKTSKRKCIQRNGLFKNNPQEQLFLKSLHAIK